MDDAECARSLRAVDEISFAALTDTTQVVTSRRNAAHAPTPPAAPPAKRTFLDNFLKRSPSGVLATPAGDRNEASNSTVENQTRSEAIGPAATKRPRCDSEISPAEDSSCRNTTPVQPRKLDNAPGLTANSDSTPPAKDASTGSHPASTPSIYIYPSARQTLLAGCFPLDPDRTLF
jgi:hypothetical protein